MDKWVTYTGIIETAYLQLLLCLRCCGRTLVAQLRVKLGVFQNLATHYDRNESGLRRKTVPLHRSEMLNQMSVDIKKERNHLLSLPLHDGLQTVHRTVLRLSKNRDSLTNSWLISMCFPGGFDSRFRLRSATAFLSTLKIKTIVIIKF